MGNVIVYRLRQVFLGHWRTKGVAAFFAVIIWFVAYKTESLNGSVPVRVVLVPRSEKLVVIKEEALDSRGALAHFDHAAVLSVSGPRKEIERLQRELPPRDLQVLVEAEEGPDQARRRFDLTGDSIGFIEPGVEVTSVSPEAVHLTFDVLEERELPVEPVYQGLPEGMETEPPQIEPARVALRGPRSILASIRLTAEAWLRAEDVDRRFEGMVGLNLRYPDSVQRDLVERTVSFLGPREVKLAVVLRYKSDFFDADSVRVRFLVPPSRVPLGIHFEEEPVAVRFQGPVHEIRRLKERIQSPEFVLAVRVPPLPNGGSEALPFTFTEDSLLLYGSSERVQILQHPRRQAQGKGAWTYTLVPQAPPPEPGPR